MAFPLTIAQITALAPDPAAAKNGQALSSSGKWQTLGRSDNAVWGEIRGSGANPYQAIIDLSGPAFKCSCPSRKFPCKHGLALGLIAAGDPAAVPEAEPPTWVTDWLNGREDRAKKKSERAAKEEERDADPALAAKRGAAKEKRSGARHERIRDGIADLQRWLKDLMRQGIAAKKGESGKHMHELAGRMVDAQAPGLARLMRRAISSLHSGEGWQERFLHEIALLHLLAEGFQRLETLTGEQQADVRTAIGIPPAKEEILAGHGVRDRWFVLGRRVDQEDNLRIQRTWLWGDSSRRTALFLDFAPGRQPFETMLEPGVILGADLVFYPGSWPVRALIKERLPSAVALSGDASPFVSVAAAVAAFGGTLGRFPWVDYYPFSISRAVPVCRGGVWWLNGTDGRIPLSSSFAAGWPLAAISGGKEIRLFGEWDGSALYPLTVFGDDGRAIAHWNGTEATSTGMGG